MFKNVNTTGLIIIYKKYYIMEKKAFIPIIVGGIAGIGYYVYKKLKPSTVYTTIYQTVYTPEYETIFETIYSTVSTYVTVYQTVYTPEYETVYTTAYQTIYTPEYVTTYTTVYQTVYTSIYETVYTRIYTTVYTTVFNTVFSTVSYTIYTTVSNTIYSTVYQIVAVPFYTTVSVGFFGTNPIQTACTGVNVNWMGYEFPPSLMITIYNYSTMSIPVNISIQSSGVYYNAPFYPPGSGFQYVVASNGYTYTVYTSFNYSTVVTINPSVNTVIIPMSSYKPIASSGGNQYCTNIPTTVTITYNNMTIYSTVFTIYLIGWGYSSYCSSIPNPVFWQSISISEKPLICPNWI